MRLLHNVLLVLARQLYRCLFFLPKRTVLFLYAPSSAAYKNLDTVYEVLKDQLPCVKTTTRASLKNSILLAQAKVVVYDQTAPLIFQMQPNAATTCVQIWHSSGLYKKVGFDAVRLEYGYAEELIRIHRLHGRIDYFIISDPKLVQTYSQAFRLASSHILPLGLARTDTLSQYRKTPGKKVLLYAPTFRTRKHPQTGKHERYQLCALHAETLQKALGDAWELWFRKHPTVEHVDAPGWKDVSDMDQYTCLAEADILVTDYSSILFDFSLLRRPIYLYTPDKSSYTSRERKLYLDPEELCPKSVCETEEELLTKIREEPYTDPQIFERFMSACDGHASERIARFIKDISCDRRKKTTI